MAKKYISENGQGLEVWDKPSNATLFAHWTARSYQVTLNQNGATTEGQKSVTATYDSNIPTVTNLPSRNGYTFNGYVDSSNVEYINRGGAGQIWDKAENSTLIARWIALNYTATFSSDGYYKGTESITVASGTLFSISDIPQKALQTFDGYYDSNNVCYVNSEGNGVRAFDKAQNTTFYAKFHQDATVFVQSNITTGKWRRIVCAHDPCTEILLVAGAGQGLWYSWNQGETWYQSNITTSVDFDMCVVFGKEADNVVAVMNSSIYSSQDRGETYQYIGAISYGVHTIAYGNDRFLIAGTDGVFTSTDGVNWVNVSTLSFPNSYASTYGNGKFIQSYYPGTSTGSSIYYSTDNGVTWNVAQKSGDVKSHCLHTAAYDELTKTFAIGDYISNDAPNSTGIWYSADGINWTQSSLTGVNVLQISAYNGMFVAATENGVYCSDDQAKTWRKVIDGKFYSSAITDINDVIVGSGDYQGILYYLNR